MNCNACKCSFSSTEDQKNHYRLDWHRYNLKRKVVDLPPVSLAQFNMRKQNAIEAAGNTPEAFSATCENCKKTFSNPNVLKQHVKSKKHQLSVKKAGIENILKHTSEEIDAPKESTAENDFMEYDDDLARSKVSLDFEDCIFCSHRANDFEGALLHMHNEHGFFVPDLEYVNDLEGLVTYVAEKVKLGHLCLFCPEKGKIYTSHYDCQKHMIAKSHCKLLYQAGEDLEEYAEFHDFGLDEGDEDWETESEEEVPMESLDNATDYETADSKKDSVAEDEEIQLSATGELLLPDGRCIGRRQLRRYYRQNLRLPEERPAVLANTREKLLLAYSAAGVGTSICDATLMEQFRKKRNNIVGFKSIKESRTAHTLREKHRGRLDFRSHKMQNTANRKVLITV